MRGVVFVHRLARRPRDMIIRWRSVFGIGIGMADSDEIGIYYLVGTEYEAGWVWIRGLDNFAYTPY